MRRTGDPRARSPNWDLRACTLATIAGALAPTDPDRAARLARSIIDD